MTPNIEVILFDMGGTLRNSFPTSETTKQEKASQMIELIGGGRSPQEFFELLAARSRAYFTWARETRIELNPRDLWTRWMLPDWPPELIGKLSSELNQLWREATGTRILFPETEEVVLALFRRGYRLGIVSNTASPVEVPRVLKEQAIAGCFETVVLSCNVGIRKPDPAILLEAASRMGVPPGICAYVGDRLDRDVECPRKAGFAKVVIRRDAPDFAKHQADHPDMIADHYIDTLRELLEIFPAPRNKKDIAPKFDASLSTMWLKRNFPSFSDFLEGTRRLGFASIELNHQMNSAMLNGTDHRRHTFSSVHEPCPADISTEQLKERDWLISSPNEEYRQRGVHSIKRSIDLAKQWNLPVIVVHCGMASVDLTLEKQLRKLFDSGLTETEEYHGVRQTLIEMRAGLIGPRLEAVKKSLHELLEYAHPHRIRLGLENRYHYFDIPSLDEMGELLTLAGPDQLGFVYDVGHAQAMDRLGFFPREEWLRRYSSRIIEVHLHDVQGVSDHLAPGLGEVDFDLVASYLPQDAIRTLELLGTNTPGQVKAGLKYLAEHGCIKTI